MREVGKIKCQKLAYIKINSVHHGLSQLRNKVLLMKYEC